MIADRYVLGEQLGSGGTGTVHRAHDLVLERDVAIKRLRPGTDESARARLRAEARLCGSVSHPGIAQVYDYGEESGVDGEVTPYLVMELVEGVPLRQVLRSSGPLPPERTMAIVAQLADALAVAHAAGIVHRDVKPGNILLRPDGAAVLVDFGIARSHDLEPLTLTGTIIGTVDYISPEQAAGEGATARSDLYSLGMVAYECLTGERPLRRETQVGTLLAHLNEDAPPLPDTVPAPVRSLVQALVSRDPAARPADAATTAALARAVAGEPVTVTLPAATGSAVSRRSRAWAALAVAAAVIVALGVLLGRGDQVPRAAVGAEATPSLAVPVTATVRSAALVGRPYGEVARELDAAGLVVRPMVADGEGHDSWLVTRVAPQGTVPLGSTIQLWVEPAPVPLAPTAEQTTKASDGTADQPARTTRKTDDRSASKSDGKGGGKAKGKSKGARK
ncbi:MAG TPA: serine/threonine-protein kinase [Nocardioides sp.]|uniref:serine/threonine-protein kinase n=1 Tax=Nocardioides sp. TaxID=35761 RepID=UPI002ED99E60